MGNKVNPVSFRLHQTQDWDSLWHDKSSFAKKFNEDVLIKEFITNFFYLRNVSVSNLFINRNLNSELFIHLNIYLLNNKNSSKLFQKKFRRNFYLRKNFLLQTTFSNKKIYSTFKKSALFNKKSWKKFTLKNTTLHIQTLPVVLYKQNFLSIANRFSRKITGQIKKNKVLSNKITKFDLISKIDLGSSLQNRVYNLLLGASNTRRNLFIKKSFFIYKNSKTIIQLNKQKYYKTVKKYNKIGNCTTKVVFKQYLENIYCKVLHPNLIKINNSILNIERTFWKARFRRQRRYFWKHKKNPLKNKRLRLYLKKNKKKNLGLLHYKTNNPKLYLNISNSKNVYLIRKTSKKYLRKTLSRFVRRFVWFYSNAFSSLLLRQLYLKGNTKKFFYLNYSKTFNFYFSKLINIKNICKKKFIVRASSIDKRNVFTRIGLINMKKTPFYIRINRHKIYLSDPFFASFPASRICRCALKWSLLGSKHVIFLSALLKKKQLSLFKNNKKNTLTFKSKWKFNNRRRNFVKNRNKKTFKLNVNNTKSFYLSQNYYYYLLFYYNSVYLNKVIERITQKSGIKINWNINVTDQTSLTSTDIGTYIKKSLTKRRFQRRLFNPLRLVKNKLGDELVFFRKIHKFKQMLTYSSIYNVYYLNLLKNKTVLSSKSLDKNYFSMVQVVNSINWNSNFSLLNKKYYLEDYSTSIKQSTFNKLFYYSKYKSLKKNKFFSTIVGSNLDNTKTMEFIYKKNYSNELLKIKKEKRTLLNNFNYYLDSFIKNFSGNSTLLLNKNKIKLFNSNKSITALYNKQYWNIIMGYQINGYGRLGTSSKSTRSNLTTYKIGKVVKNTLDYKIDYNHSTQITKNGIYGLKVFKLYKVFDVKNYINKLMINYSS